MLKGFDETIGRFQVGTGMARQLKVGMGPALSRRMLLRAIPAFQERHPEIQIVLLSINERAEIEDEAADVLVRPRSRRQSGVQHRQPQG
jgi:DNA-binding transcriptional LysR family regulator